MRIHLHGSVKSHNHEKETAYHTRVDDGGSDHDDVKIFRQHIADLKAFRLTFVLREVNATRPACNASELIFLKEREAKHNYRNMILEK